MNYSVVFDVVEAGYRQWTFPAFGLIFIFVGTVIIRIRQKFPTKVHLYFACFFLGFALLWTSIAFIATFGEYNHVASALRDGRCEVTEGIVTDFHPMPWVGHQNEWFVVNGERFEYSDYNATAGFNQTASHGGPMRQGIQVRINHIGGKIAKLEVVR